MMPLARNDHVFQTGPGGLLPAALVLRRRRIRQPDQPVVRGSKRTTVDRRRAGLHQAPDRGPPRHHLLEPRHDVRPSYESCSLCCSVVWWRLWASTASAASAACPSTTRSPCSTSGWASTTCSTCASSASRICPGHTGWGPTAPSTFPTWAGWRCWACDPGEVQQELTKRLKDGYLRNPQVAVLVQGVEQPEGQRAGSGVASPGPVAYFPRMTIVDAISAAGGFTETGCQELRAPAPRARRQGPDQELPGGGHQRGAGAQRRDPARRRAGRARSGCSERATTPLQDPARLMQLRNSRRSQPAQILGHPAQAQVADPRPHHLRRRWPPAWSSPSSRRIYEATASIVIELSVPQYLGSGFRDVVEVEPSWWHSRETLGTEFRTLNSHSQAMAVARALCDRQLGGAPALQQVCADVDCSRARRYWSEPRPSSRACCGWRRSRTRASSS